MKNSVFPAQTMSMTDIRAKDIHTLNVILNMHKPEFEFGLRIS